jgi:hypothetical protein
MSREFPNQDPYLPPGVSPNDPHFGGGYESEADIDYANEILGWLEEAEGSVKEAAKMLVALGESNADGLKQDMKVASAIENIREALKDAIKTEEDKISGEYYEDDGDWAYECSRDDEL